VLNANDFIGSRDVLFITFDSLRFDVATEALETGLTPVLKSVLPESGWELRHTPATFTYAAHHAFFAGFLPTPAHPGRHERLFASTFQGSKTTSSRTFTYSEATWVEALANRGYHTVCVGGVGFFNGYGALGSRLPALFEHAHWFGVFGVESDQSTRYQVQQAMRTLGHLEPEDRMLMFINLSATHAPTRIFLEGATRESRETQSAALRYADAHLEPLFDAFRARGGALCILCSDHGEAFGEDGFEGHRLAHEVVWNVPYAEFLLEAEE
jgi:Sulfatase